MKTSKPHWPVTAAPWLLCLLLALLRQLAFCGLVARGVFLHGLGAEIGATTRAILAFVQAEENVMLVMAAHGRIALAAETVYGGGRAACGAAHTWVLRNEPALYGPTTAALRSSIAPCCVAACCPDVRTVRCAESGIDDGQAGCHRSHTELAQGLAGRCAGVGRLA